MVNTAQDYTIHNGTYYKLNTPPELIKVLEQARQNHVRVHFSYGNTDPTSIHAGFNWLETNDVNGYIGRSQGPVKVPILLKLDTSKAGSPILDNAIVRVRTSSGNHVLWQHPNYHTGKLQTKLFPQRQDGKTCAVYQNDIEIAAFSSMLICRIYLRQLGIVAPMENELLDETADPISNVP